MKDSSSWTNSVGTESSDKFKYLQNFESNGDKKESLDTIRLSKTVHRMNEK